MCDQPKSEIVKKHPRNIAVKSAIFMIRAYQRLISAHTPRTCRFYPTCSAYTLQAIEKYGFLKGTMLGTWRILRCNPFGKTGSDPVP